MATINQHVDDRFDEDRNIVGLTENLKSLEDELTFGKSVFFSTNCVDYHSLMYVLEGNGWKKEGVDKFELVDDLFGEGHIKKLHDSSVIFFSKDAMIGFLGFRRVPETNRSVLNFTVIVQTAY